MTLLAPGSQPASPAGWQRLRPFPGALPVAVTDTLDLQGALERYREGLRLRFRLQGAIDQLILPPAAAEPARCDGLWQHTCFEAFWGVPGAEGYWELNASPSGAWNLYGFDRYRQGLRPTSLSAPPRIAWTLTRADAAAGPDRLELELELHGPAPEAVPPGGLEASLTAVLEHREGGLSYWALRHPGPEPDFHDRQGFRLRL
ncbi:MAG: DOMON-like domain-containing protein [Cyanobacteriota bacterium]